MSQPSGQQPNVADHVGTRAQVIVTANDFIVTLAGTLRADEEQPGKFVVEAPDQGRDTPQSRRTSVSFSEGAVVGVSPGLTVGDTDSHTQVHIDTVEPLARFLIARISQEIEGARGTSDSPIRQAYIHRAIAYCDVLSRFRPNDAEAWKVRIVEAQ